MVNIIYVAMPSITIKGVPDDLMNRLRTLADEERRSMNQQAIRLLEEALESRRPAFSDVYRSFVAEHGPSPLEDFDVQGLRSLDTGRPSPFAEVPDRSAGEVD